MIACRSIGGEPLFGCDLIERNAAKLLEARRELRVCYHPREEGTEKGKTDVAKSVHVQSRIEDRRTWVTR
jgi:hypothetical protein